MSVSKLVLASYSYFLHLAYLKILGQKLLIISDLRGGGLFSGG